MLHFYGSFSRYYVILKHNVQSSEFFFLLLFPKTFPFPVFSTTLHPETLMRKNGFSLNVLLFATHYCCTLTIKASLLFSVPMSGLPCVLLSCYPSPRSDSPVLSLDQSLSNFNVLVNHWLTCRLEFFKCYET